MATIKEQEELIEVLKFTPRTYRISLWGYGGEKVMGRVDREVWDYCMENSVDLQDIAWNDEDTVRDDLGLDVDKLPFPPGSWYECDDMAHVNGVSRDAGTLQIEDENGESVIEAPIDSFDGGDGSPQLCCNDEVWVGSRSKGEVVFIGSSNEKGTFFEGEINLTDIDFSKPAIWIFGNEARGFKTGEIEATTVSIPMTGNAESLNLSAAAAIVMHEISKGR